MQAGIYANKKHPQDMYLLIGLARQHYTNEEIIVYVPLQVEKEWSGTARMSYRTIEDFNDNLSGSETACHNSGFNTEHNGQLNQLCLFLFEF